MAHFQVLCPQARLPCPPRSCNTRLPEGGGKAEAAVSSGMHARISRRKVAACACCGRTLPEGLLRVPTHLPEMRSRVRWSTTPCKHVMKPTVWCMVDRRCGGHDI